MKGRCILLSRVACGVLAAAAMSGNAWAQSSTDLADGGEIIVTATRSASVISKTPISVSAFSNEQMQKQGVRQFQDLVRLTPGLQLNESNFGSNDVSIRGIRSNAGAATTGIYIDDVPIQQREMTGAGAVFPAVFDLERVEVLRGPQGTLFGSGSQGGTVRFIRAQPSLTDYSGLARAEGSVMPNHAGSYELGLAIGGPLIEEKLGFRVSAYHRHDGGWIDKVAGTFQINPKYDTPGVLPGLGAGQDANEWNAHRGNFGPDSLVFTPERTTVENYNFKKTTVFSGALTFAPTENLKITPSFFHQNERNGGVNRSMWMAASDLDSNKYVLPDFSPGAAGTFTQPAIRQNGQTAPGIQLSQLTLPDTERGGARLNMAALNLEWDFGPVALYSTSSYLQQNRHQYFDYTNGYQTAYMQQVTAVPGSKAPSLAQARQKSFIQELRLQSNSDGALKWVAGVFYQHSKQKGTLDIEVNTWKYANNFFGIPGPPPPDYSIAMWGADTIGDSLVYAGTDWTTEKQLAGFAQADLKLTDQLTVVAGVRYSRNWLDYTQALSGPENNINAPYGDPPIAAEYPGGSVTNIENAFTPKIGLNFQMDDRNLLYASASKGYRPGGGQMSLPGACNADLIILGYVDDQGRAQTPLTYGSDTVWAYEVGMKNRRLFGGAVNFAGSAFVIKWKDIQTSLGVPTCGYSFVDNLTSATVKGFDFELDVRPFESLTLAASGGYQQMKLDDALLSPAGGTVLPKGRPVGGSGPSWRLVFSADYQQPITDTLDLYARTDVTWQSRTPRTGTQVQGVLNFNPNDLPAVESTLVNSRLGVRQGPIDISLFVNNVFNNNKALTPSAARNRAFWTTTIFRPRQIGMTAAYRF